MTHQVKVYWLLAGLFSIAMCPAIIAAAEETRLSQEQAALQAAAARGENLWRQVSHDELRPTSSSRGLLGYALTLCEARAHPERIERLLATTRSMQDRDPKSKQWGNLRWYWRDEAVTDANAVEFCMHDALLIHIRHRDWLPEKARQELDDLLRAGVEGCLRHRVPTDYTNMAIMNAGNLIVLGERLQRADAAKEGYRRLDALCELVATFGVHEFCSPTYYGTDLSGLLMIRTCAARERQRAQAGALLKLFWTDIAANWFPAAERMSGCHSRSYDYLRGVGALDWHLWVNGWLHTAAPGSAERCEPWTDQWQPPPQLIDMAQRQLPRLVRQHWGMLPAESRTNLICADVSLSCCGAAYGAQDSTLAVDLAGGRDRPRCYFIADGREDPYGKTKYETGPARHAKALHMQPFWAGAQRGCDALGLAIYRGRDVAAKEVIHVQSHFVLRRTDEIWLDGKRLAIPKGTADKPSEVPLAGGSLVLRYGSAAVGVRVPWSITAGGQAVAARLVDDGNPWNCLRVTVDHGSRAKLAVAAPNDMAAGAAFWVRVGSGLAADADFAAWRNAFESAPACGVTFGPSRIQLAVAGKDGQLSIAAETPWDAWGKVHIEPRPYQGTLEIDGREVGRPLLTAVEPLASFAPGAGPLGTIAVPRGKPAYWPADAGLVLPGMTASEDVTPPNGRSVGQDSSPIGQPSGIVVWSLAVEKPGRYWLWARARSIDAKHGAFALRVSGEDGAVMPPATWQLRSPGKWQWQRLEIQDGTESATPLAPAPLDLPEGVCRIELQTRQSGTRIDRLMLSDDPRNRP